MTNTLHKYPVMLHLRHFVTQGNCEAHLSFGKRDVTNTPQVKLHRIIVKLICHFVSQMILYLGSLLQCSKPDWHLIFISLLADNVSNRYLESWNICNLVFVCHYLNNAVKFDNYFFSELRPIFCTVSPRDGIWQFYTFSENHCTTLESTANKNIT
jgi:hypothetical protein